MGDLDHFYETNRACKNLVVDFKNDSRFFTFNFKPIIQCDIVCTQPHPLGKNFPCQDRQVLEVCVDYYIFGLSFSKYDCKNNDT